MNSNWYDMVKTMQMPTVIDGTHESCYQAYQILMYVRRMLERGDSHQTILDMIGVFQQTKRTLLTEGETTKEDL